jgi:hypothetical protein
MPKKTAGNDGKNSGGPELLGVGKNAVGGEAEVSSRREAGRGRTYY